MIDKPFKTVAVLLNDELQVVYNLFFQNAYYSLECYINGRNPKETEKYSLVENFTDDEGEAELFLQQLTKGKVYPIHIKDLAEDFLVLR